MEWYRANWVDVETIIENTNDEKFTQIVIDEIQAEKEQHPLITLTEEGLKLFDTPQNSIINFNINYNVKIQLTEIGRQIIKDHDMDFSNEWQQRHGTLMPFERPPIIEDENGWSTWQLWQIIKEFGSHIGMSTELPFNPTIQLITE
jgi:hypothetical protein